MCLPLKPVLSRDRRGLPNFMDEPFNGLDKHGVSQMHELILAQKKKGKTILLSSHSQKDIDVLCDVVCEMDGGVMHCIRDRMEDTYAG